MGSRFTSSPRERLPWTRARGSWWDMGREAVSGQSLRLAASRVAVSWLAMTIEGALFHNHPSKETLP